MKKLMFIGVICLFVSLGSAWARGPEPPSHTGACLDLLYAVITAPCQILVTCLGLDGAAPPPASKRRYPKECGYSSTKKVVKTRSSEGPPIPRERLSSPTAPVSGSPKEKPRAQGTGAPQTRPARETVTSPTAPVTQRATEKSAAQDRVSQPDRVQPPAQVPPITRAPESPVGPPRVTTQAPPQERPAQPTLPKDTIRPEPRPSSGPAVPIRPAEPSRQAPKEQGKTRSPARGGYWSPCMPIPRPSPCY